MFTGAIDQRLWTIGEEQLDLFEEWSGQSQEESGLVASGPASSTWYCVANPSGHSFDNITWVSKGITLCKHRYYYYGRVDVLECNFLLPMVHACYSSIYWKWKFGDAICLTLKYKSALPITYRKINCPGLSIVSRQNILLNSVQTN